MRVTALLFLLMVSVISTNVIAHEFYLLDGDRFKAEILDDQHEFYLLKKDGETYSMFFKHHRIEKKHIFAVFDEDRNIVYPKNLEKPVVIEGPGADISIEKLSDVEYRNYFIRQTYEEQRQVARSVTGIRNIMLIQLALVVIAGSIAALAI